MDAPQTNQMPADRALSTALKKLAVYRERGLGCAPKVRTAWIRGYRLVGVGLIFAALSMPGHQASLFLLGLGALVCAEIACIARAVEWSNEFCADGDDDRKRQRVATPQLPEPEGDEQLRLLKAVILAAGGSVTVGIDHACDADRYVLRPTDLPHRAFARCYSLEPKE
jgi:hypothetical protein